MIDRCGGSGILIGKGGCWLRLSRSATPHDTDGLDTELGHQTRIDIEAGPFRGSFEARVYSYRRFRDLLLELQHTLIGVAELSNFEEEIHVFMEGDGKGHIAVQVVAISWGLSGVRLSFKFDIDQTYLPVIISAINREFLNE